MVVDKMKGYSRTADKDTEITDSLHNVKDWVKHWELENSHPGSMRVAGRSTTAPTTTPAAREITPSERVAWTDGRADKQGDGLQNSPEREMIKKEKHSENIYDRDSSAIPDFMLAAMRSNDAINQPRTGSSSLPEQSPDGDEEYKKNRHFAKVGRFMKMLYKHDQLSDILVRVGTYTFSAHRVMLACHSEYVVEMLLETPVAKEIIINEVTATAFQKILDYIYTAHINLTNDNVVELLSAVRRLRIRKLEQMCADFLAHISPDKAFDFMEAAERHGVHDLYHRSRAMVMGNLASFAELPAFLNLDIDRLCALLSSDDLIAPSEVAVVRAGAAWIDYQRYERVMYAGRAMGCVRFPLMDHEQLFESAAIADYMFLTEEIRDMLLRANWYRTSVDLRKPCALAVMVPKARNSAKSGDSTKLLENMKHSYQDNSNNNAEMRIKQETPSAPTEIEHYISNIVNKETEHHHSSTLSKEHTELMETDSIILMGGWNPENLQKDSGKFMHRFDVQQNRWDHFSSLPRNHINHGAAMMRGALYIIGGCDPVNGEYIATNAVYKYDLKKKAWQKMSGMKTPRMHHNVCVLLGAIYAIGGQDTSGRILSSVECYNSVGDRWCDVSAMNRPRIGAAACMHKDLIFVAGGYTDSEDQTILSSVEAFDPHHNTWTTKKPLPYPVCNATLIEACTNLFLCGGATRSLNSARDDIEAVSSISMIYRYDDRADSWGYVSELEVPRHNASCATIGSKIFIIGGFTTLHNCALASVECYDASEDAWIDGLHDLETPCVSGVAKHIHE